MLWVWKRQIQQKFSHVFFHSFFFIKDGRILFSLKQQDFQLKFSIQNRKEKPL